MAEPWRLNAVIIAAYNTMQQVIYVCVLVTASGVPKAAFYFFCYSSAVKALACGDAKDIDSFRRVIP